MTESGIPENWEGPRSFGRRMGRKLSPARLALIERLMPELGVELKDVPDASLDPTSLFSNSISTVWLEIGFGKGEHLLAQAKANPDVGFIGCEPFVNGVASALVEIEQQGLENIRIYPDDARTVLKALAPQSVERVFLLHPDPWPKTRHADRRFANPRIWRRSPESLIRKVNFESVPITQPIPHGCFRNCTVAVSSTGVRNKEPIGRCGPRTGRKPAMVRRHWQDAQSICVLR